MKNLIILVGILTIWGVSLAQGQDTILNVPINKTDSLKDISSLQIQTDFYYRDWEGLALDAGKDGNASSSVYFGLRQYLTISNASFPIDINTKDILFSVDLKFADEILDGVSPKFPIPNKSSSTVLFSQSNEGGWFDSQEWGFYFDYFDTTITTNLSDSRIKIYDIGEWNSIQILVKNSDLKVVIIINEIIVDEFDILEPISFKNDHSILIGHYSSEYLQAWVDNIRILTFDDYDEIITNINTINNSQTKDVLSISHYDLSGQRIDLDKLTRSTIYIKLTEFSDGTIERTKIIK